MNASDVDYQRPTSRVLPNPAMDTASFWAGGGDDQLMIHFCDACGKFFHPPAPVCFRCRSIDVGPEPVSGLATVATFSIVRHAWYESFPPPYVVAIVELADQADVRLTTNIVGCQPESVFIGQQVSVFFERCEDVWIPLFTPVAVGTVTS